MLCPALRRACSLQTNGILPLFAKHLSTKNAPAPKTESTPEVTVRVARRHEMAEVHNTWCTLGMDLGIDHMRSFLDHLSPDNYLVAIVDGKIVGACANSNLSDDMTMQGALVIHPNAQGMGIGRKVRFAGAPHIGNRNIVCDAVPDMADTYHGWGYVLRDYINISYSGHLNRAAIGSIDDAPLLPVGQNLLPQAEVDFRSVMEFDRKIHFASPQRTAYMKWFLDRNNTISRVLVEDGAKTGSATGKVVALGAKTELGSGHHFLGPIYAEDPAHAELLMRDLAMHIPDGAPFHTMAPLDNSRAGELLSRAGLQEDARALRMYSKRILSFPLKHIFASTVAGYAGLAPC